jgi:hypothetical protein
VRIIPEAYNMGTILGIVMFFAIGYAFGYLVVLIRNGFNFHRAHEFIRYCHEQDEEERARKRRENQRIAKECEARRKERLGW